MALTKRTYVDGQTIITAANLNDIQDHIITVENNYVPKTRTVAGKALSSNITLAASDVGAVPTSRTINSKALTGNITLSAADVGAVPVARTVNGKALSSNITLNAADVSAVPTTRTVNGKALSSNITLTSGDISDDSGAGGSTVKASLTALRGSFGDVFNLVTSESTVTIIPDGTDYNDLQTPGNYICQSAASAATMSNCPSTGGHKLIVLHANLQTRVIQLLFTNSVYPSNMWFIRTYTSSGWKDWNNITSPYSFITGNHENTTVATKAYSKNDYIATYYTLYRVISAISNGGTLTVDTNVVTTSLTDELTSIRNLPTVTNSKAIPSNTDLNSLTECGSHECPNTATSRTYSNCPVQAAFSLLVLKKGSYYIQVLFTGTNIYTRTEFSSGWGHWYSFSGTDTGS